MGATRRRRRPHTAPARPRPAPVERRAGHPLAVEVARELAGRYPGARLVAQLDGSVLVVNS